MERKCAHFFEQLLALILALCAIPVLPIILIVVVLPNLILRRTVRFLASIFQPEFSKILTHRSTIYSLEETHAHTENAILIDSVFEGNYSLESCKANFHEKILNSEFPNVELEYPELQQYIVSWMNFNFWKNEDNFDLNEHVQLYNKKRPEEYKGDEVVTRKEFHEMRNKFCNTQFPKNKSPWEVILVHNYSPDDPILRAKSDKPLSVMILKSHHSLGDGFSIKKLLLGHLFENREGPNKTRLMGTKPKEYESFRSGGIKLLGKIWNILTFPFRGLYELMFINIQLLSKSDWHVPENKQAPSVHAFTNLIPVSRVKWIKDQLGVSFSSVLFHVCNEAMQKMMVKKKMKLKNHVVTIFPLPLPNHPNKLRNYMTHGLILLPTSPELSPVQRLNIVQQKYEEVKESTLPITASWMTLLAGGMVTSLGKLIVRGVVPPVVISNFPGDSSEELYCDDNKVLTLSFNSGLLNLSGLAFAILTMGNYLSFGVTANSNILSDSDVKELVNMLEKEFNLLEEITAPRSVAILK